MQQQQPLPPPPAAANRRTSAAMSPAELKKKTITCLNRLSDRDTFPMASAELDSMAVSLSPDAFSHFLSCLSDTDSSLKSPVRCHSVRLVTTLARAHSHLLSPFLPKILHTILLRRLRDPDSSVRSACVDAVSALASTVTRPPFSSSFLHPLADALLLGRDPHLQLGGALCLAAAVESSPSPDPAHLQRLLPRLLKLLRSDGFKAKPAVLAAVASFVRAGGARNPHLLGVVLVPTLVRLLGNGDWAVRKAATEALLAVAETDGNLVGEFKATCLVQFEAKKFDKVRANLLP